MQAILLAAGNGDRLWPITEKTSKPMIKICGKPIIGHLMDELEKAGVNTFIVIAKKEDKTLHEYVKSRGGKIIIQQQQLGTGNALLCAEEHVKGEFLVLAADSLTESSIIKKLIAERKGEITLAVRKVLNPHSFGVVELSGNKVSAFEEKPKHPKSDLANISIYAMNEQVFDELKKIKKSERGEYEIIDILLGANAVIVEGLWMDLGYPWHLLEATEKILERLSSEPKKIVESTVNGKIIMEEGAEINHSNIEGNIYLGKNSKIGPGAYLRGPTSIGEECEIGMGTTVKSSLLLDGVKAKHLTYIGDSIIGNNVNFGSGTQLANFRFDEQNVKVYTKRGWTNTGRKKFGAVVGDNTKFGVLSSVMPGKLIGSNCWIHSGVVVNKNVGSNKRIYVKHPIEESEI